jgi:A/G-specific adenine glycosylase
MSQTISKKIVHWYHKHKRNLPWRKYKNKKDKVYKTLVSEYMLQQTKVITVIPFFNRFYKEIPNLRKLSKTSSNRIYKLWQGLGYYRRARFLLSTSKIIMKKFNGKIPSNYSDLITLPGIGDYTAKAILSIAHDKSEIGIDGNVKRLISRIFFKTKNLNYEKSVNKLKINKNQGDLMQGLMELGALVCLPQNPLCSQCPINQTCNYNKQTKNKKIEKVKFNIKKIKKFYAFIILKKNEKILLNFERNLGPLKNFINVPIFPRQEKINNCLKKISHKASMYEKIKTIKIHISNFCAVIDLYKIYLNKNFAVKKNYFYVNKLKLKDFFVSNFLKKILKESGYNL